MNWFEKNQEANFDFYKIELWGNIILWGVGSGIYVRTSIMHIILKNAAHITAS